MPLCQRRVRANPAHSVRSSFRKIRTGPADVAHSEWVGKVQAYSSDVEDIDWEQPRILWELFKKNGEDEVFIQNLAGHVNKALPEVQKGTISKLDHSSPLVLYKIFDG
jgi:catalase